MFIKNILKFNDDIYVPYDSIFQVKEYNGENVVIKNHKIKKIYSLNVISGNSIVNIEGNIFIKLKIDEKYINYKRIKLYNNYNGEYEEINYSYKDGYLTYNCNGLGDLIISTQDVNLIWLYILCSLFIFSLISYCVVRMVIKHNEIHRYKSLKRGKDYGNC